MSDKVQNNNQQNLESLLHNNNYDTTIKATSGAGSGGEDGGKSASQHKLSFGMKFNLFIENNRIVITSLVFGVLASVVVLGTYVGFIAPRINKTIATVDIQTLMQEVTLSTFKDMTGLSPDKQSDLAKSNITQAGHRMEQALAIISERNHVVLVQKQALAFDKNVPDFTDEVRNALKVSK